MCSLKKFSGGRGKFFLYFPFFSLNYLFKTGVLTFSGTDNIVLSTDQEMKELLAYFESKPGFDNTINIKIHEGIKILKNNTNVIYNLTCIQIKEW